MSQPAAIPQHTLSKSDFKLARTCPTKLYYREMKYRDNSQDDEYMLWLAEGGFMVEAIAKLSHPDGIAMEYGGDPNVAWRATSEHLSKHDVTLFEATIIAGRRVVRVDILRKSGPLLELYEVKAKGYEAEDADKRIVKTGSQFRALVKKGGRYPLIPELQAKYLEDIAYQVDVAQEAFPTAEIRPRLVFVNKDHRTAIDGLPRWFRIERQDRSDGSSRIHRVFFTGNPEVVRGEAFVKIVDVAEEVTELLPEIRTASSQFVASLDPVPVRLDPVLRKDCGACEFKTTPQHDPSGWSECWGTRAAVAPHILELYYPPKQLDDWIAAGGTSLFDIPEDQLVKKDGDIGTRNERQLIQIHHTRQNKEWIGPKLGPAIQAVKFPLHFIDFEAARCAIPHHVGMRPYGQVAFQWSCHTQREPGATFEHREWINVNDLWPNHEFARTLREALGTQGSVLTWSHFERSVLNEIASDLVLMGQADMELGAWLAAICAKDPPPGRILDLYQLCLKAYFHPGMGGGASIKTVLDCLWRTSPQLRQRFTELEGHEGDPEMGPYVALPPISINGKERYVQEGTGAIRAYEAMIYGVEREDLEAKNAWRDLLLRYCKLDTVAMVLIWEYWARATSSHSVLRRG
jgi:hypothetical protein